MTFVKRQFNKNHHKLILLYPKASWKSFRVSVPGFGHSDIRGFGDHSPYRQVNGPPWALPSNRVDHMSANIEIS